MTARRQLGETLLEIAQGAISASASAPGLVVRRLAMTLPIEIGLLRSGGEWRVLGDLPRTLTRTPFDTPPGRLEVIWTAGEPA